MKREFFLRLAFAVAICSIFLNCNGQETSSSCCAADPDPSTFGLNSIGLFPLQNSNNWWWYSSNGHPLSIHVLDTTSDNHTTYFKVSFAEAAKDTTINWIRRTSLGTEYSTSLPGPYFVFLPPTFNYKQGSFSLSSSELVSYSYLDSLLVNGKYRKQVMELTFPNRNIHGFDEIDFAVGLGIIRMIDNSGRFPVVYALDSARINGVINK